MNSPDSEPIIFKPFWADWPEIREFTAVLQHAGITFFFTGGAVRDAFRNQRPADIDIRVLGPAAAATHALEQKGYRTQPPEGKSWPVHRAWINNIRFDVGELINDGPLSDIETCAKIIGLEMDFTVNSMTLMPSTWVLYDFFGARKDIAEGKLRFMEGQEQQLVQKKAIFAIRFFRMHALIGRGEPDPEILSKCIAMMPQIFEWPRIYLRYSMMQLLGMPNAIVALRLLYRHELFKYTLGYQIKDLSLLEALETIETIRGEPSEWLVRLALLLFSSQAPCDRALEHLRGFWEMEETYAARLELMINNFIVMSPEEVIANYPTLKQTFEPRDIHNMLLMRWAMEDDVAGAKEPYEKALITRF